MPRWDDPRGPRQDHERDRWRRDQMRDGDRPGGERRAFDDGRRGHDQASGRGEGFEPWRGERAGARYDQDRVGYGWREGDAANRAYERHRAPPARDSSFTHGGEPYAYGGQEYGVESHGGRAGGGGGAAPDPGWGFDRNSDRRRNFDLDDVGSGQSPAGYRYHREPEGSTSDQRQARTHPDQEFDDDYLRWREEQLRAHDRDYQDWRRDQQRQHDEEYRRFRQERQRNFGRAFHEWRAQRSTAEPNSGDSAQPDAAAGSTTPAPINPAEAGSQGDKTSDAK